MKTSHWPLKRKLRKAKRFFAFQCFLTKLRTHQEREREGVLVEAAYIYLAGIAEGGFTGCTSIQTYATGCARGTVVHVLCPDRKTRSVLDRHGRERGLHDVAGSH